MTCTYLNEGVLDCAHYSLRIHRQHLAKTIYEILLLWHYEILAHVRNDVSYGSQKVDEGQRREIDEFSFETQVAHRTHMGRPRDYSYSNGHPCVEEVFNLRDYCG